MGLAMFNPHTKFEVSTCTCYKDLFNLFIQEIHSFIYSTRKTLKTRMWPDAQRDGRPAEYRWHPLFNAAKFG